MIQAILETKAISKVKPAATSMFLLKTQNIPKVRGKQRNERDIHKKTFDALSAA